MQTRPRKGSLPLAVLPLVLALLVASGAAAARDTSGTTLFVATNGSDNGRCTQNQPCASLGRAYMVARPADIVEISSGQYGDQELSGSRSRTGRRVIFRPAAGATVTVGGVTFDNASGIELRDLTVSDWYMRYSSNVVVKNVTTRFFFIRSSDNVRILGGSVGGIQDGTSATIGSYAGAPVSTNITVDGVFFHDIGRQNAPGAHVECLFLQEASGVVIRNSKFTRCDIMDLYVSPIQGGPTASNVTVENNWFDSPTDGGYHAFNLHPDNGTVPHNFTFRFNSIYGTIYLYPGFNYDNVVIDSNVGRVSTCDTTGITYRFNVWTNQKCGPSDKVAPSGFVNPGAFDLHLKAGSRALGAGDPSARPARDIEGDARPARMRADAGADQRDPASIVPGKSIGAIRLGETEADVNAFYGASRRLAAAGGRRTASYRLHRGTLWATYAGGRVVGAGTTSRYYTTKAGLGVGSRLSSAGPVRLELCRKAFRARIGGAVVYLGAHGKGPSARIAHVSVGAAARPC